MSKNNKNLKEINDEFNISESASTLKMFSYALTFYVSNIVLLAYSYIGFYFYEVEVGLSITLVALAQTIYAIWNMFNDPLVGYLTDRPMPWTEKWGMRAPWIIISVIPTVIFFFLIFTPPELNPLNQWPVFWYMLLITCLYDTFYSIYTEHYSGGFAAHFRSENERHKASLITSIVGTMGTLTVIVIPPLIYRYGDKSSFTRAAGVGVIIMLIAIIFMVPGIKESDIIKKRFIHGYQTAEKISFWKTMKYAFRAKNFMISLLAYTLYTVSYTLAGASAIYFMKDVLRVGEEAIILPNILNMAFTLISMPIWLKFGSKKLGQKKMYALGLIWMGLTYIPVLWYTDYIWAPILASIGAIGLGCFTIMVMPVVSDCYDEVSTITGKHQEATLLGVRNFFIRISIIAQSVIMAITHQITNYNPDPLALQSELAIIGIRISYGLIPALCLFVAAFAMIRWYDLEGEKKQAVLDKLKELKI